MREKLRVALLGSYPVDAQHIHGGVQAAYAYLVNGLSQIDDLDLHILTMRGREYQSPEILRQGNKTLHILPPYPRFERLRGFRTYQKIINKKLAQVKPDLIHVQDAGSDALVALRSGYPTVITLHGVRWEDGKHYSSLIKRLRVFYDSFVTERYVIRNIHHLIATGSPYVVSYYKRMLRPDIAVYTIPNAIDERFFQVEQHPDEQIVLFAGRVIPRKRVMDLVQAFALVLQKAPSASLRIAGEIQTEPAYVETIQKWVREHEMEAHVQFLGPLPEDKVQSEFSHCSVLALPSAQETTPLVIAQAMAAGKPVVATRVGGVADMIGSDGLRGFTVEVGDIYGMAEKIACLLQNPDLRERMSQNNHRFALEYNHLGSVAARTFEVYQAIAARERKTVD